MPDPGTILQRLRAWLKDDTFRRVGKDTYDYERGFEDGWDAAREEVAKAIGQDL